ncbi:hypothetical protein D3C72_1446290 [compost metagenome]
MAFHGLGRGLCLEHGQEHAGRACCQRGDRQDEAHHAVEGQGAEGGVAGPHVRGRRHVQHVRDDAGLRVHGQLGFAGGARGAEGAPRVQPLAEACRARGIGVPHELAGHRHVDHMLQRADGVLDGRGGFHIVEIQEAGGHHQHPCLCRIHHMERFGRFQPGADGHHQHAQLCRAKQQLQPDGAIGNPDGKRVAPAQAPLPQEAGSALGRLLEFAPGNGLACLIEGGQVRIMGGQDLLIHESVPHCASAARAICRRCISEVPSPMRNARASR